MPRKNLLDGTRDAFVESRDEESIRTWTALAGAFLVALGSYLPWLRYNPNYEGVGIMLTPQTTTGFEWVDLILVFPVVLLVAYFLVRGPTKWWARTMAIVGSAAVLLPALRAWNQYANFDAYYVPDIGLAVTVLGGVLLVVAGGYDRFIGDGSAGGGTSELR